MKEMTSRERLLCAIRGDEVDRIPVSPRIWRYGLWKGKSELELSRELGFDLFVFGTGGLATPFSDSFCELTGDLVPNVKIETTKRRKNSKTFVSRTFRTPGGTLHDEIVKPDANREYGISPNHEWLEPLVKSDDDVELIRYLLPEPKLVRRNFPGAHALVRRSGPRALWPSVPPGAWIRL